MSKANELMNELVRWEREATRLACLVVSANTPEFVDADARATSAQSRLLSYIQELESDRIRLGAFAEEVRCMASFAGHLSCGCVEFRGDHTPCATCNALNEQLRTLKEIVERRGIIKANTPDSPKELTEHRPVHG